MLKNLSSTESHYFELKIYIEKYSNWRWLKYFIDSSNLVPRPSISFFVTDIQYKKGDKKALGSRLWLSQKKTFSVLGYFSDFKREFYWLVFKVYFYKTTEVLKHLYYSPVDTGGITDFLKLSYNQTSAIPPYALDILLSKFITSLKLTTYKYSVNIGALKDIFKLSFRYTKVCKSTVKCFSNPLFYKSIIKVQNICCMKSSDIKEGHKRSF